MSITLKEYRATLNDIIELCADELIKLSEDHEGDDFAEVDALAQRYQASEGLSRHDALVKAGLELLGPREAERRRLERATR